MFSLTLYLLSTIFSPLEAFAFTKIERLSGQDRYETAIDIALKGWPNGSKTAVLAFGGNFPDALAATPLAAKHNAPILLTHSLSLTTKTKEALDQLGVEKVILVGGTGVISTTIENQLINSGISTQRVAGDNRFETSLAIANQVNNSPTQLIVTTGNNFPSALSISSFAANQNIPIILVSPNHITENTKTYLSRNNIKQTYIVGNTNEVSESVKNLFPNSVRIYGSDEYGTNLAVFNHMDFNYDFTNVFLARGDDFADALAGSAYAAKTKSPILLVNNSFDSRISNLLAQKNHIVQQLKILGGEAVIPSSLISSYTGGKSYTSSQIFNRLSPSVVYIEAYDSYGKLLSTGSGFFLDSSGKVATNYHVINRAYSARVKTANGETYTTDKVLSYNPSQDVAIIKIEGTAFTPVTLGNSDNIETGNKIYTIGNPLGLENTISDGLISTKSRFIDGVNLIQISAPISPGSSGGVLVNEQGEVIGITSSGINEGQNLNFAIPINILKPLLSVDIRKTLTELNALFENPVTPSQPALPVDSVFFPELSTVPMPIGYHCNYVGYTNNGMTVYYIYYYNHMPSSSSFINDYWAQLTDYGWEYYNQTNINGALMTVFSKGNYLIGVTVLSDGIEIMGYIH